MNQDYTEVVLPDGSFARIRPALVKDMVLFFKHTEPIDRMCALAERLSTIDGESVTHAQVMAMPYELAVPIFGAINRSIEASLKTMNGIA